MLAEPRRGYSLIGSFCAARKTSMIGARLTALIPNNDPIETSHAAIEARFINADFRRPPNRLDAAEPRAARFKGATAGRLSPTTFRTSAITPGRLLARLPGPLRSPPAMAGHADH